MSCPGLTAPEDEVFAGFPQTLDSHHLPVRVEAIVNDHRIVQGKPFTVRVQLNIVSGFHINSNHPKDKYLIPTQVIMKGTPDFIFKPAKFPPAVERSFEFSTEKLSVFEGEVELEVPGVAGKAVPLGRKTILGSVRYQACDNNTCYPPRNLPFEIPVDVVQ